MPKTLRNKYYKNLTYEKLMQAHIKSRKGKGNRKEIIMFNLKQEEYIMWLLEELKNKTYKHGGYTTFYVTEPKLRKIEKSRYIDRIVHRWLVDNFLEPAFIPQLINTTYACIKNRGMHKACLEVQKAMRKCKNKWGNYYILKMDIAKYFDNINKKILLKIRYYFRYMDDSTLFLQTKKEAIEALKKIKEYLKENLELELNKKTQIFKDKQGVNFCGYKINENRLKIRDKGKRKLKKKVKKLKQQIKEEKITSKEAYKYLAGHMGYIEIADTYMLEKSLFYTEE